MFRNRSSTSTSNQNYIHNRIYNFKYAAIITIILFCSVPLAVSATQAAPPTVNKQSDISDHQPATIKRRGTLYLVRDLQRDHTAYLFGTVHVGQTGFYPLEPEVIKALSQANKLILEVDIRDADALQQAFIKYGMYPTNQTLAQHVSSDTLSKLKRALTSVGVTYDNVARMKPWMVANVLLIKELEVRGYPPEQGIEMYFLSLAKQQGKSVAELETAGYQLSLFDSMTPVQQEIYLRESMADLADGSTLRKSLHLLTAWRNADSKELMQSFRELQTDKSATSSFEQKVLIDGRNPTLAKNIEAQLKQDKASFVAIGAFHLLGEKGVPALLQQRGYQVQKLY